MDFINNQKVKRIPNTNLYEIILTIILAVTFIWFVRLICQNSRYNLYFNS